MLQRIRQTAVGEIQLWIGKYAVITEKFRTIRKQLCKVHDEIDSERYPKNRELHGRDRVHCGQGKTQTSPRPRVLARTVMPNASVPFGNESSSRRGPRGPKA